MWAEEEKGTLCSAVREARHWGGWAMVGGLRKGELSVRLAKQTVGLAYTGLRTPTQQSRNIFWARECQSIHKINFSFRKKEFWKKIGYGFEEEDTGVRSVRSYNLQKDNSNKDFKRGKIYIRKRPKCSVTTGC